MHSGLNAPDTYPNPHLLCAAPLQASFEVATPFIVLHRQLKAEVAAADAAQPFDIVFYGDNIIERLRGTSSGG